MDAFRQIYIIPVCRPMNCESLSLYSANPEYRSTTIFALVFIIGIGYEIGVSLNQDIVNLAPILRLHYASLSHLW